MPKEAKHTPGPWVQFAVNGKCAAIMPAGRADDVCEFSAPPSDADAALMTAAPDMMAALEPKPTGIPQPVRIPPDEFYRIFQEIGRLASSALSKAEAAS